MSGPLRGLAAVFGVLGVGLVVVAFDAAARQAECRRTETFAVAIVDATGSPDLSLSSGSRWLRHLSAAEPAAGCAGPTCLDSDPAGLALPPPRATFGGGTTLFRVPE